MDVLFYALAVYAGYRTALKAGGGRGVEPARQPRPDERVTVRRRCWRNRPSPCTFWNEALMLAPSLPITRMATPAIRATTSEIPPMWRPRRFGAWSEKR